MVIGVCDDDELYLKHIHKKIQALLSYNNNTTILSITPNEIHTNILNQVFPYDILVTDIDMGHYNGIELVKMINIINPSCSIIFLSNHIDYATSVYDTEHVYFVLKSEVETRLLKALKKAIQSLNLIQSSYLNINYLNIDNRIALSSITYIESFGRYLCIHADNTSYKCINSLKAIHTDLSNSFIQCHKSYLINLDKVSSMSRTSCTLMNGTTIPISYTYQKSMQKTYVEFISNKLNQ